MPTNKNAHADYTYYKDDTGGHDADAGVRAPLTSAKGHIPRHPPAVVAVPVARTVAFKSLGMPGTSSLALALALAAHALTLCAVAGAVHAHAGTVDAALRGAVARVATVYGNVRRGAYRIDCAIGAAPIQMAECQIVQGVNLVLIQCVTQLAEFVYSIAHMKNVFGCATLLAGVVYPIRSALSAQNLARPLLWLARGQRAYFAFLCGLCDVLCSRAFSGASASNSPVQESVTDGMLEECLDSLALRRRASADRPARSCPGRVHRARRDRLMLDKTSETGDDA